MPALICGPAFFMSLFYGLVKKHLHFYYFCSIYVLISIFKGDPDLYLDRENKKNAQRRAERDANYFKQQKREAHYNSIPPNELVQELYKRCDISDIDDIKDLTNRMLNQVCALDTSFAITLHEAGLGHKTALDADAFKMALEAQKLCRQTFDSLQTVARNIESQKQTQESKKDET